MILSEIEIAYAVDLLEKLAESADKYIDEPNWLESMTDDINNAKRFIKKYQKLLAKEIA